jgi:hypothetical protein
MKHIEVSKKIELEKKVSAEELKNALVSRLEKTIEIETITDDDSEFKISGTTGAPASFTRHARIELDVSINFDSNNKAARVLISGYARTARSLVILYAFLFLALMLIGLLPGSIETSYEQSGAADALVLLILGIFIIVDINKKLTEPKEYLETALQSLDTTFG